MNYEKNYDNLINSRKLLKRNKKNDGYLESHHIKPSSLGGSDKPENLVLLTPTMAFQKLQIKKSGLLENTAALKNPFLPSRPRYIAYSKLFL